MHRMSPLDASFLHLEDHVTQLHIGSVAIFEGPPPPFDDVLEMVAGKLALVPRYRQVVRFVPLAMGRPVWVDDSHFNLGYHLRRTALPAPGGEEELRILVGRVMSQQLDRAKPLWEMWMVEGLGDGRWALVSKVHHCMVDGVSGTDLLTVILDQEREPACRARSPGSPSRRRPVRGCWPTRSSSARSAPTRCSAPRARRCARRASSPSLLRGHGARADRDARARPAHRRPRRSTGRSARTGAGAGPGRSSPT